MLVFNNTPAAFWMGNLVNKNLEGQEILSQVCQYLQVEKYTFKNMSSFNFAFQLCFDVFIEIFRTYRQRRAVYQIRNWLVMQLMYHQMY